MPVSEQVLYIYKNDSLFHECLVLFPADTEDEQTGICVSMCFVSSRAAADSLNCCLINQSWPVLEVDLSQLTFLSHYYKLISHNCKLYTHKSYFFCEYNL